MTDLRKKIQLILGLWVIENEAKKSNSQETMLNNLESLFKSYAKDLCERVIGEGNEKLPPIEAQPHLWSERNARNYLRQEQRMRLAEELQ